MKANELRIGNKLLVGGGLKEDCVVLSISDKLIGYETETRKGECNIEWLSAIPLNQDLLLKFGFVDDLEEGQGYEFKVASAYPNDELFLVWNELGLHISGKDYALLTTPIKYVHQLQNLYFAIAGTEVIYENEIK